jgi:predicted RNA-binding protein
MKLFNLNLGLGLATFVAEDVMQVLCLILKHNELKYIYQGVSSKDILKDIKEIPGYNVSGEPGVIAFYRE